MTVVHKHSGNENEKMHEQCQTENEPWSVGSRDEDVNDSAIADVKESPQCSTEYCSNKNSCTVHKLQLKCSDIKICQHVLNNAT